MDFTILFSVFYSYNSRLVYIVKREFMIFDTQFM